MAFFILGLPRSRTAWLANFMTYGKSFCFHEGINGCRSWDEYRQKLQGENVGDSGTGLMLVDLEGLFPGSKKVIIESDLRRTADFLTRTYGVNGNSVALKLQEDLDRVDGLRIPYDSVNDSLEEIWTYLSDEPFNPRRAEMLVKLNIQIQDPHDLDYEAARVLLNG